MRGNPGEVADRVHVGQPVHVDGDVELVLDFHEEFHHLEGVERQVGGQAGVAGNVDAAGRVFGPPRFEVADQEFRDP